MAGALAICGDDFEAPARQIARENGIPHIEEDGLTVQIGYYDAGGIYGDFSEYKNFEADPDPDTRFFSRSHAPAWECILHGVPTIEHGNEKKSRLPHYFISCFISFE